MASDREPETPLIIEIEGNSREDGPGIRSVVFFKGCLLDCLWCQNPESKKKEAELWWDRDKCINGGECIEVCPQGAISRENPFFIDRNICDGCFKCVEECPSDALRRVGMRMSIDEIVQKVLRYKPFFDASGGGVTLSGGDPTQNMEFTSGLLQRFKKEGVHTLLQTAGMFSLEDFTSMILPYTDMIFFDIKMIDSARHQHYCGANNRSILKNFLMLLGESRSGEFELLPRTPLIPGITDGAGEIASLIEFYKKHDIDKAVLLPSNPAWIQKLDKIGMDTPFRVDDPIHKLYPESSEQRIKRQFSKSGIDVRFG